MDSKCLELTKYVINPGQVQRWFKNMEMLLWLTQVENYLQQNAATYLGFKENLNKWPPLDQLLPKWKGLYQVILRTSPAIKHFLNFIISTMWSKNY